MPHQPTANKGHVTYSRARVMPLDHHGCLVWPLEVITIWEIEDQPFRTEQVKNQDEAYGS
jgi:hypothetical protein